MNANAELTQLADAVEAAAYRDMFAAAPTSLARSLGLETREIAGATLLIAPGIPTPFFNRVIGIGNEHPATDADLDAVVAAYRAAGVKNWWMHLTPDARPASLPAQLGTRGFTAPPRRSWAKVVRGVEAPPEFETAVDVRRVRAGEEEALGATIAAAFEMPQAWSPWFAQLLGAPRWRGVAALDAGQIIGGGLLHLQGANAWLGAGGVRPEARRRGAHRALMALRIHEAVGAGCTCIVTETGEAMADEPNPSLRNMEVCGFRKICSRLNYAAPM